MQDTEAFEPPRKASQEAEIDHLLAEEFACDPAFGARFLAAAGVALDGFTVDRVIPEPSLGGEGFGDLLVQGHVSDGRVALLVEDKISAGAGVRQAQRYQVHANRLRTEGWDKVVTILVAPHRYRGESADYDARVSFETVMDLLTNPSSARLEYRRGILERAINKAQTSGVRIPDAQLHTLKAQYLAWADSWCARYDQALGFPALRDAYFDGDSWIEPIHHADLPEEVFLRHRLWTSIKDRRGQIDLIVKRTSEEVQQAFEACAPPGTLITPYSKGRGIQASFPVAEMRQDSGFDPDICQDVLEKARQLVTWYLKEDWPCGSM